MNDTSLFSIGKHHADHLALRQNAIARNIANISVPGYKSVGVSSFSSYLRDQPQIRRANGTEITEQRGLSAGGAFLERRSNASQGLSGNNVSLEAEVQNAGAIRREFSINTTVLKSFHKMFLSALKIA